MNRSRLSRSAPLRSSSELRSTQPLRRRERLRTRPARVDSAASIERAAVRARSGGVCERCREHAATDMHHLVTRARGGWDHRELLAHLCRACHTDAHASGVWPWILPGRFVRGVYEGPDERLRELFGGWEEVA